MKFFFLSKMAVSAFKHACAPPIPCVMLVSTFTKIYASLGNSVSFTARWVMFRTAHAIKLRVSSRVNQYSNVYEVTSSRLSGNWSLTVAMYRANKLCFGYPRKSRKFVVKIEICQLDTNVFHEGCVKKVRTIPIKTPRKNYIFSGKKVFLYDDYDGSNSRIVSSSHEILRSSYCEFDRHMFLCRWNRMIWLLVKMQNSPICRSIQSSASQSSWENIFTCSAKICRIVEPLAAIGNDYS